MAHIKMEVALFVAPTSPEHNMYTSEGDVLSFGH